jgi:hypothetical protein
VRPVGYLLELHRDARSPEYKSVEHADICFVFPVLLMVLKTVAE